MAIALILLAIPFLRQPDLLVHAQLYAEDGMFVYADGYNHGWILALALPYNGSLLLAPRMLAALSAPVSVSTAPFLVVGASLLVGGIPAVAFLHDRFAAIVPNLAVRSLISLLVQAMPNSWEVVGTASNVIWHLAPLAALLLIIPVPVRRWVRIADLVVIAVAAASGPFSLFLAPVAIIQWLRERTRWRLIQSAVVCGLAVVDIGVLVDYLVTPVAIGPQPIHHGLLGQIQGIGATPGRFFEILAARIFLMPLLGTTNVADLMLRGSWIHHGIPVAVDIVGGFGVLWVAIRARPEVRLFLLFAGLVLAASLARPMTNVEGGWWPLILQPILAPRYFYIPLLGCLAVIAWLAFGERLAVVRVAAAGALVAMVVIAIPQDWVLPTLPQSTFTEQAAMFDAAPSGTTMRIDISPPGWFMTLTRR